MTLRKRFVTLVAAVILGMGGLEAGEWLGIPGVHGFSQPAFAVVGRPLTPVSVAGVARRSVRRCVATVVVC